MFGFQFIKFTPAYHVFHYSSGRLKRSGAGLAFYFYKPSDSIVAVPLASADVPFIFNEITADCQSVTVQGQLTYRIRDAQKVSTLLNFTVDGASEKYISEDPQKLGQRLVNLLQVLMRADIQRLRLGEAIFASEPIAASVFSSLLSSEALNSLGVEVIALSIQAIRPVPEMARAMEAEAREELLRQADQALYDRRNASVEQECRIKENELNTEIALEEKRRQIREAKVDADLAVENKEQQVRRAKISSEIDLETERKRLIVERAENMCTEADAKAYALEASLRPVRDLDPAVLQMLAVQNGDSRLVIGLAMKELAQNAGKIGNLNISPELLETLMLKKS